MATENGPNIFESCVYCCPKCKGLSQCQDEHLKHQLSCGGNPFKSTSLYFACERKIFLQLYQSDDFPLDGYFNVQNMSKDDSFINHVVKIRLSQETFDPSIFLRSATSGNDPPDDDFLLDPPDIDAMESDINNAMESDINKDVTYLKNSKSNFQEEVGQEQLRNIINKNINYLKSDPVANLSSDSSKRLPYEQAGVEHRLLSPIEKHFMHDVSKSRLGSPFEKNVNFLQDTSAPYQSSSFQYSSNQSIPYSCNLSTDLLGSLASTQDENQQSLQTSIEECPTLQYLDLAKKDPFFGQNLGLTQVNAKDPFLINATVRLEKPPTVPQKYPPSTKEDLHATPSPTFPLQLQDVNYFNFGSMLDEPTQLDYLDLATLDFLTNPNFGNYGTGTVKDKYNFEVDRHDMYNDSSFISNDLSNVTGSDLDRFGRYSPSIKQDTTRVTRDDSMVKKGKKCLPKRTKSCSNVNKKKVTSKEKMDPALEAVVERMRQRHEERRKKSERMTNEATGFMGPSAKRSARKRKYSLNEDSSHDVGDRPKWKHERRFNESQRLCPSNDILNVKKHLTGFTEEEMRSLNAVLGLNSITIKKQKTSVSKRVENSQSSQFNKLEDVNDMMQETSSNKQPKMKNMKVGNAEKQKSVLKCPQCDFHCMTVEELQEHCDENRCVFKCQECSFTCNNELSLKEHCSRHKYHVNLKCQQCNFICVKVSELISHMSVHKRTSVLRTNEQAFEDTYYGESFTANAEYETMRMWLDGQRSVDDSDLYAYESLMSIRSSASDSGLFVNFVPNSQKSATDPLHIEEDTTSDIKFQRSVSLNDSVAHERTSHVLLLNQMLPPVNESLPSIDDEAMSVYESASTGNESVAFIREVDAIGLDKPAGCSTIDDKLTQSVNVGTFTSDPNALLVNDGTFTSDPNALLVNSTLMSSSVSTTSSDSMLFPDELTLAVKSISLCSVPDTNNVDFSDKELNTVSDSGTVICSTKPLISEPRADVSQIYVTSPLLGGSSSQMIVNEEQSTPVLTFGDPELRSVDESIAELGSIESMAFENEQLTPDDKCIVVFPELIEKEDIGCGREISEVDTLSAFEKSKECTNISDDALDTEEDLVKRQNDTNLGQNYIPFTSAVLSYDEINDCENGGINKYVSEKALSTNDHYASVAMVTLSNSGAIAVSSETPKVLLCKAKVITSDIQSETITGSKMFPNNATPASCKFSENGAEPNKYSFRPIKSDGDSETAIGELVDEEILCGSIGTEKSEDTDFVKSLLTDNKTPAVASSSSQQSGVNSITDLLLFTQTPISQFIKQLPGLAEMEIPFQSTTSELEENHGPKLFESKQMRQETHLQGKLPVTLTCQQHVNVDSLPEVSTTDARLDLQVSDQSTHNEALDQHHAFQPFTVLAPKSSHGDCTTSTECLTSEICCTGTEKSNSTAESDSIGKTFQDIKTEFDDHGSITCQHQKKLPRVNTKSDAPIEDRTVLVPDDSITPDKVAQVDEVYREESTQFPEYETGRRSKNVTKDKKVKRERKKSSGFHCRECTYQCDTRYRLGKHVKTHSKEAVVHLDKASDDSQEAQAGIQVESSELAHTTVPIVVHEDVISSEHRNATMPILEDVISSEPRNATVPVSEDVISSEHRNATMPILEDVISSEHRNATVPVSEDVIRTAMMPVSEDVISNGVAAQTMQSSEHENATTPTSAFICSHCSFTSSSESGVVEHEAAHSEQLNEHSNIHEIPGNHRISDVEMLEHKASHIEQFTPNVNLKECSNIHEDTGNHLIADVEVVEHESVHGKQLPPYVVPTRSHDNGDILTSEVKLSEHDYSRRGNLISRLELTDPNETYWKLLSSEQKHGNAHETLGESSTLGVEVKQHVNGNVAVQGGTALPQKTVPEAAQKGPNTMPEATQKGPNTMPEAAQKGRKTEPEAAQKGCKVIWVGLPEGKTLAPPTPKKKDPVQFCCQHCDFKTKQKMSLERHIHRIHTGAPKTKAPRPAKEVYLCDTPGCGFQTTVRKHLHTHEVEQHQGLRTKLCDNCGTLLPDFASFQQHQRREHQPQLRFKCSDCGHRGNLRADIIKHYRRKHLRQQQYACNLCEYHTDYVQQLKFHLMAHAGIRPYKCSACDYHVNNMNKLTRHIKTRHKGERGVTCEKTDLTYCVDGSQFRCSQRAYVRDGDINVIELTDLEIEALYEREKVAKTKKCLTHMLPN